MIPDLLAEPEDPDLAAPSDDGVSVCLICDRGEKNDAWMEAHR